MTFISRFYFNFNVYFDRSLLNDTVCNFIVFSFYKCLLFVIFWCNEVVMQVVSNLNGFEMCCERINKHLYGTGCAILFFIRSFFSLLIFFLRSAKKLIDEILYSVILGLLELYIHYLINNWPLCRLWFDFRLGLFFWTGVVFIFIRKLNQKLFFPDLPSLSQILWITILTPFISFQIYPNFNQIPITRNIIPCLSQLHPKSSYCF